MDRSLSINIRTNHTTSHTGNPAVLNNKEKTGRILNKNVYPITLEGTKKKLPASQSTEEEYQPVDITRWEATTLVHSNDPLVSKKQTFSDSTFSENKRSDCRTNQTLEHNIHSAIDNPDLYIEDCFMITQGIRIHYRFFVKQNSETILMLHGNNESIKKMKKQIELLIEHFQIIAIDNRGHGLSSPLRRETTYEDMRDDVIKILDHHNINKTHIVGFSDGGIIALLTAIEKPEIIDKIVATGVNISPSGIKRHVLNTIRFLSYLSFLFSKNMHYKLSLMTEQPTIELEELNKINHRTLLIFGENDLIKDDHILVIKENIKCSTTKIFDGGDHFIPYKKTDAYIEEVLTFFNG